MTNARIVQKTKNAMQSGRHGTDSWMLEFEATDAQHADPLMGWAGSGDTRRQLNLKFKTLQAAQNYATKNGINAVVIAAAPPALKLQAYADNFR
jgi:ETC complex I subunit conserved region